MTDQQLEDLFVTAIEQSTGYWCEFSLTKELTEKYADENKSTAEMLWTALLAGETLNFSDVEDPMEKWELTLEKVKEGCEKLFLEEPAHYANVLTENCDAETADVWFQYCLLGELVFG